MIDKKTLRQQIRQNNSQILTPEYRQMASKSICRKIAWNRAFMGTNKIALYHALPDEPDLTELLERFAYKKELYLPRVEGEIMNFYRYEGEDTLQSGSFGIQEPLMTMLDPINPCDLELIIVPGMAFTRTGVRLGRGKAFYDRFLPHTNATLIGVTFDYRIIDEIPTDQWDVLMHEVITN